jgi:hypothetical protein
MNLLSGMWVKVSAALAFVVGGMWMVISGQASKISRLNRENKAYKKKSKITAQQSEFKERTLDAEQEEIKGAMVNAKAKSIIDRLNDM